MNFFSPRRRARRVSGSVRRRAGRFLSPSIESLEGRRLLAAGNFGVDVVLSPYTSFVNLLQTPGTWTDAPGDSNPIVLNSSGDPESDAALYFDLRVNQSWNGPDPNAIPINLSGTYNLTFNGQATVQPEYGTWGTWFTVQNQVYNAATNTTTMALVVPASNTSDFFGITFLNTEATPVSTIDSGFSNAVLIRPGYAANSTQLYTNQFLSALQPFSTIRYLNPDNANNQPFFSGNALVTEGASQVDQTGTPWEYLIALANQTQTDMWINVPQGATNAYITALAGIFKNGGTVDGVTYSGLDSNLKIYLEYSNEVWGGISGNYDYQEAAVTNSAANQPLSTFSGNLDIYNNIDGTTTTNVNTAIGNRYLEETADIGQIFQSVLGADSTHQRIRPVLGWQESGFSFYPAALDWYQHFFGSVSTAFYGMGDADYLNASNYASVSAVISSLQAEETSYSITDTTNFTVLSTFFGLANVSYEGGPAVSGDGTTAAGQTALAASRSSGMEQVVLQHYLDFYAAGGALAMYEDGPYDGWSPQNEWGAAELGQYGNPTAAAKYRGLVDVSEAAPVAVTTGIPVSATGQTSISAGYDSLGDNFVTPTTGQQGYWLLKVASSGTYDLKLTTVPTIGLAPGQVEVFVDNQQVGGTFNVGPTSTTIDLGNLSLTAGLETLSLVVVHGMVDPSQANASYYEFAPSVLSLVRPGSIAISDFGFENVAVGAGNFVSDPNDAAYTWTFSGTSGNGSGLSGNGSALTSGNPNAPQGSQVAFLQGKGSITESVADWNDGSYTISFNAAQSATYPGESFEVLVDGNIVGSFTPSGTSYQTYTTNAFPVTSYTNTIEFVGLNSAGSSTALVDNVTATIVSSATPPVPTLGDAGFEEVPVGAGNSAYDPTGSTWTFSGSSGNGSGVTGNGSALTSGNPSAPQGSQVAFLQVTGSMTQTVINWAAGSYALSFDSAQRGNSAGLENFEVLVDGNIVGTFTPSGTSYQSYTTNTFNVPAGSHTIEFLGLDSAGGPNTALIDAVALTLISNAAPAVPTVGDAGFEEIPVGAGNYSYDPTGSAWTFSGTSGNGSGVAGNGSAFTGGNPNAPQGSQVAFLQGQATITQSVGLWAAGAYTISFDAAQRAFYAGVQNFEVLVDGNVVGSFAPTSSSYKIYTTNTFTVPAGMNTIEFLGIDTAAGSDADFLDNVSVAPVIPTTPTIGDYSFEQVSIGAGSYAYSAAGSAWTFSGAGLASNGSAFTSGNPSAPLGSQVAFLQNIGTITQSVANWGAGTYTLSFDAATRGSWGGLNNFEVLVDGAVVGTFKPTTTSYQIYTTNAFTVPSGANTIEFLGINTAGGDDTDLIDDVTVAVAIPTGLPTIGDYSFEQVSVGAGSYVYSPAGSAWTFSGAGLAGNGSAFTSGNPSAPQGSQVAFLQNTGTITQAVAGWAAGSYTLSFDAATRGSWGGLNNFEVLIDGIVVGTFKPTTTSYQIYTTNTFTVPSGANTIEFLGINTAGGDDTDLIDDVTVAVVIPTGFPTIGDYGFEQVPVGAGNYAYSPSGSAWTFNGAGLAGNGSAFTSGNPSAPQGSQVAFLQNTGSITQAVAGWAAGSYTLSFDAAQRGNGGGIENFEVLVDGIVVGTFKPTTTSYQIYTTNTFTVPSGANTIEFLGINTAGGDDTDFLDNVTVA